MARKVRVEYPGAIYHVMSRGDRGEAIFRDDADRRRFLDTLGEACEKTGWQVHAYCLMGNHFHMVVETPGANLVAGMKWLLGTYTIRFNRRHGLNGHVFAGRYKALAVDGSGSGYLRTVCDYVHLNPVRAGLIKPGEPLRRYPWSSWGQYLKEPFRRYPWLRVDRLMGEYGLNRDGVGARRAMEQALEKRRAEEEGQDYGSIRRGWCLGGDAFREELLVRMTDRLGAEHYGEERAEAAEARAERIVQEELRRRHWEEEELERRAKGDREKIAIAARLRRETAMTVAWIAARLHMGTPGYVHNRLYRWRKGLLLDKRTEAGSV